MTGYTYLLLSSLWRTFIPSFCCKAKHLGRYTISPIESSSCIKLRIQMNPASAGIISDSLSPVSAMHFKFRRSAYIMGSFSRHCRDFCHKCHGALPPVFQCRSDASWRLGILGWTTSQTSGGSDFPSMKMSIIWIIWLAGAPSSVSVSGLSKDVVTTFKYHLMVDHLSISFPPMVVLGYDSWTNPLFCTWKTALIADLAQPWCSRPAWTTSIFESSQIRLEIIPRLIQSRFISVSNNFNIYIYTCLRFHPQINKSAKFQSFTDLRNFQTLLTCWFGGLTWNIYIYICNMYIYIYILEPYIYI